jgi:LuxR family maltose regulon positive regulatory protein
VDSNSTTLAHARESLSLGRWGDARRDFEEALREAESPEALEGLGAAAWWQEDVPTVLSSREGAYRLFRQREDPVGAGRMATELGFDYAVFRLEMAVSSGWLQRAHRLLDDLDPVAEQVWLAFREAELAYHMAGDMQQTWRLAVEARQLAGRLGLLDLEMVGLALEGLTLVGQGKVPDAMRRLDEATGAAVAGDMHDLKAVAATCCFMVFACERVRDVDRASQWCDQFMEFYRRRDMRAYLAFCGAHHASVLMARGRWDEADAQLTTSRQELSSCAAWSMTVFERLGELRRRQGRLDEAADHFERAGPYPGGVLGVARVALDRGELDVALDLAEGMLRRIPERDRVERIATLELLVRARCANDDTEGAEEAVHELEAVASSVGTDCLRASAHHARAQLALARGDAESANRHQQDALDLYERAGLPFETSLVGLNRARALHVLGRADAAVEQARRARDTLRSLGAAVETERADALVSDLLGRPSSPPPELGLSPREYEVLTLLTKGLSNQQIADELVLSRHTVRRHISNILTKLGVSSRTGAVAFAHEHGLL